ADLACQSTRILRLHDDAGLGLPHQLGGIATDAHQDGLAHGKVELRLRRNRDAKERVVLEVNQKYVSSGEQVADLGVRHSWQDSYRPCADLGCKRTQPSNLGAIPNENELHARFALLDKLCRVQYGLESLSRADRACIHD